VKKALLAAILLAACHQPSKCEHFARMEGKCGDVGQHEAETTRTLARAVCEAANSKDPAVAKAGDRFAREADCAEKSDDCDAYKKCRDAVK
jgi:hypothetical protein